MFKFLRDKLKKGLKKFSESFEEEAEEIKTPEEKAIEKDEAKKEKSEEKKETVEKKEREKTEIKKPETETIKEKKEKKGLFSKLFKKKEEEYKKEFEEIKKKEEEKKEKKEIPEPAEIIPAPEIKDEFAEIEEKLKYRKKARKEEKIILDAEEIIEKLDSKIEQKKEQIDEEKEQIVGEMIEKEDPKKIKAEKEEVSRQEEEVKKLEEKKHELVKEKKEVEKKVEELEREIEKIPETRLEQELEELEKTRDEERKELKIQKIEKKTKEKDEQMERLKEEKEKKKIIEDIEEAEMREKVKKEKPRAGFFKKLKEKIVTKRISAEKFEKLFWNLEVVLLENNVAVEVIDKIKEDLKKELVDTPIPRGKVLPKIENSLKNSIESLFDVEKINLLSNIRKKKEKGEPYVICFVGVNGSGKTTTIAKLANLFKKEGLLPVIAAGDTFRAAAIDQLEEHAKKVGVKVIKHDYGADSAAVAFDAIKYAKAKAMDVVLIDTAGRQHSNINLMEELAKVIRVSKPDITIFIGESITGNDCVEQAKEFSKVTNVNGIILSKADVDDKGGAAISISYVTKKPILYLGTGQGYDDLTEFDSRLIVKSLGLEG